jgi:phospholipid/cholesterol/gamma-HCH transport system substrate-binding protein
MEAEAKYTYVGGAVLLLVALLIGGVVWLKQTGAARNLQRYTIYFESQALDGLQVGSAVQMRGIRIGQVEDYALDRDKLNRVRVHVLVDRRAPVRENTAAVIKRNFVTGLADITLVTAEPAGGPLSEAPEGESYPVIAEGRSDLLEIAGRVQELGDMAGETLANINRFFSADNRAAATEIVGNVRRMTAELNARLQGLEATLAEFNGAARQVRRSADRFTETVDTVGRSADLVLNDARGALGDARGAIAEVRQTVQHTARAIETLQVQTATLGRRIDATASTLDDQLLAAVTDLRTSLDSVTRSLDRLSDPRTALLGPDASRLGPGEQLK